ncbi:MAG: ATP-binding cassette domain-containing protein, partial [Pseudomonadota bacterium]
RFSDIDSSEAISVTKACGMHEMISSIQGGYDAEIGATATHLSAGQAQGVGLARALFGTPVLIVLDEPSSNLDSFTVAKLTKALRRLRAEGRILLVATHDPRLMTLADQILVLNKSEIKMVSGPDYLKALAGQSAQPKGGASA